MVQHVRNEVPCQRGESVAQGQGRQRNVSSQSAQIK